MTMTLTSSLEGIQSGFVLPHTNARSLGYDADADSRWGSLIMRLMQL